MARVVIGLSGGVDSSVAAYLLQQAGHEVIGLFMINWHDTTGTLEGDCPWHDDRLFAELVARRLDIPFHTVDLSDQYRRRVVDYMFSEYAKGRTPNPDVPIPASSVLPTSGTACPYLGQSALISWTLPVFTLSFC